ncbi:5-formyltetrahydrofolate cyclo-ligase [Corynebacterium felinum]|uniref:5-formyltetrahydrofolate cyclo-ligase n=1 Tax=Corynebacterium felinum TaxID=131318 RepID=A0ABU2B9X5_9CORY|nr:5-formyltetrahydrofolate cyclo-ligase [Corynebacterium felinum]MDF5821566.1 5-formyltetrahydrofolate cyclo-ligase [Corynebacterium felinum]MDR7355076.1 5-formyltetrahydrofolate cyclo-ligase [Corynebacterium felinum]WJY94427.1 5-formyltetrahydrofolate cyclo-ligase family protein [Corynebacterium felinum]
MNKDNPKKSLRKQLIQDRTHLNPLLKEGMDEQICQLLISLIKQKDWLRVAAFVPSPTEPGCGMVAALSSITDQLWLPTCLPHYTLGWGQYTDESSLSPGAYGLLEPRYVTDDKDILHTLDAIIVPAVAMNIHGGRLGKGAGFYDRALEGCTTPTVGVVYEHEVREIPMEDHDMRCDFIVTNHCIRTCTQPLPPTSK